MRKILRFDNIENMMWRSFVFRQRASKEAEVPGLTNWDEEVAMSNSDNPGIGVAFQKQVLGWLQKRIWQESIWQKRTPGTIRMGIWIVPG